MWSEKETAQDLLGYTAHARLLKDVVTNEKTFLLRLDYMVIGVLANQVY